MVFALVLQRFLAAPDAAPRVTVTHGPRTLAV